MLINEVHGDSPSNDYWDYLKRSSRTGKYTMLEWHLTKLSKATADSYGLTDEQYNQITIVLESGV